MIECQPVCSNGRLSVRLQEYAGLFWMCSECRWQNGPLKDSPLKAHHKWVLCKTVRYKTIRCKSASHRLIDIRCKWCDNRAVRLSYQGSWTIIAASTRVPLRTTEPCSLFAHRLQASDRLRWRLSGGHQSPLVLSVISTSKLLDTSANPAKSP